MGLRVRNLNESPPGYWRYHVPETGKLIGPHPAYVELLTAVRKHYVANALLAPVDLEDRIHAYICSQIPAELCAHASGARLLTAVRDALVAFNIAVSGTQVLGDWFLNGRMLGKQRLVERAQANERAVACAGCRHNVPIGGCAACAAGKLSNAIVRIVGNSATDLDHKLNACALCGCSLKAKVWFPLEILNRHMTDQQRAAFPDWCWISRENVDLAAKHS